ncbi:MAG: hypothetical protein O6852_03810 [Gammaproteobacteria bacterium]|nr:hypothetical protein [Gammaproteobacteria bacterium]
MRTDRGIYFSEWNVSSGQDNAVLSVTYDEIESVRHAANEVFGRV